MYYAWKSAEWMEYICLGKSWCQFQELCCLQYIYIIKCTKDEEQFYKIGKTFRSIGKRIKKIEEVGYTVELLEQIVGTASDISKKEKDMHKQNRKAKYVDELKDEYDRIGEVRANIITVGCLVTVLLASTLIALKLGLIIIK